MEEHVLVNLIVAAGEELAQHTLELAHAFAFELLERLAEQIDLQDLFLLADHIVIVKDPLVRATHKSLRLSLFDEQHVVIGDGLDALFKNGIRAFHGFKKWKKQN